MDWNSVLRETGSLFLSWLPKLVESLGEPVCGDELYDLTEFVRGFFTYHGLDSAAYLSAIESGSYSLLYLTPSGLVFLHDISLGVYHVLYDRGEVVFRGDPTELVEHLCGCLQPPSNNPEYRDS